MTEFLPDDLSYRMEWALYEDRNRRSIDEYWKRQNELSAGRQPELVSGRLLKEQVKQVIEYLSDGLNEYQIRDMTGIPLHKIKKIYYRHWKPENRNDESRASYRRAESPAVAYRTRPDFSRRPPSNNL